MAVAGSCGLPALRSGPFPGWHEAYYLFRNQYFGGLAGLFFLVS